MHQGYDMKSLVSLLKIVKGYSKIKTVGKKPQVYSHLVWRSNKGGKMEHKSGESKSKNLARC